MSAKPTEGGAPSKAEHGTPPSALPGISPSRGEISSFNDDLLMIVRRVEALGPFLDTEDGKNLLAGTKRAANILGCRGEEGNPDCRGGRSAAVCARMPKSALRGGESSREGSRPKRFKTKTFPPPCLRLARCVNQLIHSSNVFS